MNSREKDGWFMTGLMIGSVFSTVIWAIILIVVTSNRYTLEQIVKEGHAHWETLPNGVANFKFNKPCTENCR